jgi:hypothetical protein
MWNSVNFGEYSLLEWPCGISTTSGCSVAWQVATRKSQNLSKHVEAWSDCLDMFFMGNFLANTQAVFTKVDGVPKIG